MLEQAKIDKISNTEAKKASIRTYYYVVGTMHVAVKYGGCISETIKKLVAIERYDKQNVH